MSVAASTNYSPSKSLGLNLFQSRRTLPRTLRLACVFAAYVLAGEIGLAIPFTSGNVSPFWPPAGVALAGMLLFGYRIWPAVALGAFIVNFFTGIPHLAAFGIALGNTVGPLCGAWLLGKLPGFRLSLRRLRDVLGMLVLGAFCGPAISATLGAGTLFLTGVNAWSGFFPAWLMWWWGDAMGVLIIAPLVLTFPSLISSRLRSRLPELACLLLGAVGSALLIFQPRFALMRADVFAFGVFPFVLWGAIRFEPAGAAIVSFLVSAVAVWGTADGFAPFLKGNPLQNATLLQSFLGVTATSGLILAAVVAERAQLIREQSTKEALEQSEKSYRGIVETAYEGIWKIDAEFITSFVNRRMAELLGYRVEEMIGRPLFDFLFEADIEEKRSDLQRRREGVSEQLECRYRRKDGSALWTRVATSPIVAEDGVFAGALAMVSDMTEQKRAETEQCHSLQTIQLLSKAVDQTADSIVITDPQGTIEYVNPAFEAVTGYRREEVVGRTPTILNSGGEDQEFYSRLWGRILDGQAFRGMLVNRKKSGEVYWAEQTITPIKDSADTITHFVSVLKDVTLLRKSHEQEVQLRLAREVQQRFYATAISVPGLDIAAAACPMNETGGDYADYFTMPDNSVCVGIGDVSGHGFDSALVMALTRAYVRAFAEMESDVGKILTKLNRMLVADLRDERFVTLLLVRLDAYNNSLTYAGAGHVPGYLLNGPLGFDAVLRSSGPPLGLFGDIKFTSTILPLKPHKLLLLVTDGVIEIATPDDEQFGTERALEYVHAHCRDSAQQIAEGLCKAARCFACGEPQVDDLTSIVVKLD